MIKWAVLIAACSVANLGNSTAEITFYALEQQEGIQAIKICFFLSFTIAITAQN